MKTKHGERSKWEKWKKKMIEKYKKKWKYDKNKCEKWEKQRKRVKKSRIR